MAALVRRIPCSRRPLRARAARAPALAGNGGFAPVEPESPNAEGINESYLWVVDLHGGDLRARPGLADLVHLPLPPPAPAPEPRTARRCTATRNLELAWTVVPVLILVAIAVLRLLQAARDPGRAERERRGRARRRGRQGLPLLLELQYPNGVIAVDTLRAPVDRPCELERHRADFDVIHSWWIPAARRQVRRDPGRDERDLVQRARRAGTYRGQCAEFCGIQHAEMKADGRGAAARRVRGLARRGGARAGGGRLRARRGDVRPAPARSATVSRGEGDIGPRLRGQPAARRRRRGGRGGRAQRPRRDAAGRQGLGATSRWTR